MRRRSGRAPPAGSAGSSSDWCACCPCRSTSARAGLGQLGRGREPAVDVGPAAAVARHDPREHDLVAGLGVHEATLDPRSAAPSRTSAGVGPPADEQLDRLDQQRLARAGLAGDRGQAGAEHQVQVGDDPEIDDVQLDQHQRRSPVGEAELGLQDLVEVAGPKVTMRAGSVAAATRRRCRPRASSPSSRPSAVSTTLPVVAHGEAQDSPRAASTSDRSKSMCGDTGVSSRHR